MNSTFIREVTDAEWLALDDEVQTAYGAYLQAVLDGDAQNIADADKKLKAAYAARDGAK